MKKWLYGALGAQLIFLLLWGLWAAMPFLWGHTIIVETMPKDPSDALRGNYVRLNYQFSEFLNSWGNVEDQTVYAEFDEQNGMVHFKRITMQKPTGSLIIRGKVTRCSQKYCYADFGIEKYFLPKDSAREVERLSRQSGENFVSSQVTVQVVLKVWQTRAVVAQIRIGDFAF